MRRPLLLPLLPLYAAGLALREMRLQRGWEPVRSLRCPVISIGNLSTGGSGKTPLTIALAKLLNAAGFHVDVLSRGYGRRSTMPLRVDPNGSADEFGDEPLLIARAGGVPVYVAPERFDAGQLAEAEWATYHDSPSQSGFVTGHDFTACEKTHNAEVLYQGTTSSRVETQQQNEGALVPETRSQATSATEPDFNEELQGDLVTGHDFSRAETQPQRRGALAPAPPCVHILDDGFQHRQLARDVDILLVAREDWHDHLLPAGNLREPAQAARRASVLAIPAEDPAFENELRAWGWTGPIWRIRRRMVAPAIDGLVAAFCGIARPEQFFAGLEAAGLKLATRTAFPDHRSYSVRDVENLVVKARLANASAFITTEKDQVRLGKLASQFPIQLSLKTASLTTEIEEESIVSDWLKARLVASRAVVSV